MDWTNPQARQRFLAEIVAYADGLLAVDTDSQFIIDVDVFAGNAPDADHALEVVDASEAATGCQVVEVLGDCAYGAGSTRAEFAARDGR